jgi:ABC-type bacteriocin/lantibiotic exporter with double-glycine peptidase domain
MSGLQSLVDADPEGLDKVITEGGGNISGGQRQRIMIARALYKSAGVIILDEPFNQLDEGSEHSLLTHFVQLAREGKLIILITHNKKSLSFCNKIVSLESEWETNNIG